MKILVASPEAVPFAKTGGLGDVVGALPKALAKQQHELKVFIPRYKTLNVDYQQIRQMEWSQEIAIGRIKHGVSVDYRPAKKLSLAHYFIRNDAYFGRDDFYRDEDAGADYADNDERFIFFSRAVLEVVRALGWQPDIVHVHDWQTSLIPAYLKILHQKDPVLAGAKSVLTIHNLAFQGTFAEEGFARLGLPPEQFYPTAPFEFYGKVNFLKAGITYADKITTVSERYAAEIQTDKHGCGLDGVLRGRQSALTGILNGVDYGIWSPSRDKRIPYSYFFANLSGKRMNKVELLGRLSLPVRERTPLIGIISRLTDQKGLDLFAEIADAVLAMDLQMVVLGTGDNKYQELFAGLERRFPDKIRACLIFDDDLAHWIEAASDMFLMPSRFEPCGLNQMYSLKYGTVPIVHEVGGLADTVKDFDSTSVEGTGFVFKEYSAPALLAAIERAVGIFSKKRVWTRIMKTGMRQDYSWDRSARKYIALFESLLEK
jgi:starch synthase